MELRQIADELAGMDASDAEEVGEVVDRMTARLREMADEQDAYERAAFQADAAGPLVEP